MKEVLKLFLRLKVNVRDQLLELLLVRVAFDRENVTVPAEFENEGVPAVLLLVRDRVGVRPVGDREDVSSSEKEKEFVLIRVNVEVSVGVVDWVVVRCVRESVWVFVPSGRTAPMCNKSNNDRDSSVSPLIVLCLCSIPLIHKNICESSPQKAVQRFLSICL